MEILDEGEIDDGDGDDPGEDAQGYRPEAEAAPIAPPLSDFQRIPESSTAALGTPVCRGAWP